MSESMGAFVPVDGGGGGGGGGCAQTILAEKSKPKKNESKTRFNIK